MHAEAIQIANEGFANLNKLFVRMFPVKGVGYEGVGNVRLCVWVCVCVCLCVGGCVCGTECGSNVIYDLLTHVVCSLLVLVDCDIWSSHSMLFACVPHCYC